MITLRQHRGNRDFLILGVTEANLSRLRAGEPIRVTAETHGGNVPPGWTIAIVWGENQEELWLTLEKAGLLSAEDEDP